MSLSRERGEVAEWTNAAVSKTVGPREGSRGFESHPLRQTMFELVFYTLNPGIENPRKPAETGL